MEPRLPNGERFIWDVPRYQRGHTPDWEAWRALDRRYDRRPRTPVGRLQRFLPLFLLVMFVALAVIAFVTS